MTLYVSETDMINMSKSQAFISLPTVLVGPFESQFRTKLSGVARHGVITCWSEVIQYLLNIYSTAFAILKFL